MKLNNIWEPDLGLSNPNMKYLECADILEAHRYLYLFFNTNDLDDYKSGRMNPLGTQIYGKAIQVNMSISKGGSNNIDIMPWIRGSNNSTYMTMNMYVYNTIFENHIKNFQSAEFTLDTALSSSTTNDYDIKKAISNGSILYSKELREDTRKKEILNNIYSMNAPRVPEPMYYTMREQEEACGDIYCITSLMQTIVHFGSEIIDDVTRIAIMDTSSMDTMNRQIRDKMNEISYAIKTGNGRINMFDSSEFTTNMLFQDVDSMQNGFIYMYDTDMGKNIIPSRNAFLPFKKYQMDEKMQGDLERTLNTISQEAKSIENKFGHVRIQYSPLLYGNKFDIFFKDYKEENQPVLKEKLQTDNGFRIGNEINQVITEVDEQATSGDYDFNMDDYDY